MDNLPQIFGAVIILAVGWVVAVVVGRVLTRILRGLGVDRAVARTGLTQRLERDIGPHYSSLSAMIGAVVKWLLILGAVGIAADALNLTQVNEFISAVFAYVPNVVVAVIILAVGFIGSQILADFVITAVDASRLPIRSQRTLAAVARYAILAFAIMAALAQLRIVPQLIEILFAGLVFALALAFGLGGRDHASEFIRSIRQQGREYRAEM